MGKEELLYNKLYEKTKDCGRTQFVRLLMDKERENQELKEQLQQKEDIINKAKQYVNENTIGYKFGEEYYIDDFDRFAKPSDLLEILDNKG